MFIEVTTVTFLAGILIGTLSAMLGLGGGFLIVPYLNLVLGLPIHRAVGTSMLATLFTASSATFAYSRHKSVHYRLGLTLALTTAPGAFLGAYLTQLMNPVLLKVVFGILVVYAGFSMFRVVGAGVKAASPRGNVRGIAGFPVFRGHVQVEKEGKRFGYAVNLFLCLTGSFAIGITSGVGGIGGGLLQVPLMTLVLGVPIHVAVATSSFIILFTSSSASAQYLNVGNVDLPLMLAVGIGALAGAQVGARVSRRVSPLVLRRVFGLVLFFIGFRMFWAALG